MSRSGVRWIAIGVALMAALVAGALAERAVGWVAPAFDVVAHQFYEIPLLAKLRRPSQLPLVRAHLAIATALAAAGFLLAPGLGAHGRRWWAVVWVGYAIRATIWIAGGNLPLVPGDSCHYLEVATSVYRGEGPVKHYVESYFRDYPAIRQNRGVLDDWATPLYAYTLAAAYRLVGVAPGRSLEATVAVAKGTSFVLNLACLPALYGFARRRAGPEVGLGAMALLAVLPVHALYAGFALRESLVALTSILAVWSLVESWHAEGASRIGWALAAGTFGGLAILSRNTAMALMAAGGLYGLIAHGRRRPLEFVLWAGALGLVIAPWAWATYRAYGEPFYTYTKFFAYNFSWTVHHDRPGHLRAADFYTRAHAPEIVRIKIKAVFIIFIYSSMILGVPVVLGFVRGLRDRNAAPGAREAGRLALLILATFTAATLVQVADVTQVAQLGRYYLPAYALALPTAALGLGAWLRERVRPPAVAWPAALMIPLLWADPTWAYDFTWLVKPYQLHWPALRAAGEWVRAHPERVPEDARIVTWFPWEFRVASDRTTILLPRSYQLRRLTQVIDQYRATHVLWGSFEPPPHVDPEEFGPYLDRLRRSAGLTGDREIYRSPTDLPVPYYPVRLYRLDGGPP